MNKELAFSIFRFVAVFLIVFFSARVGLPWFSEQREQSTFVSNVEDSVYNSGANGESNPEISCPSDPSEFYDNCTGIFTKSNGDQYIGAFKQDMMDGIGTYIYNDGTTYRGQFRKDLRHGDGELSQPDGSYYTGKFVDGELNGEGSLKLANGDSYTGYFKDGEFEGVVILRKTDGTITRGKFADGEFVVESNQESVSSVDGNPEAGKSAISESGICAAQEVTTPIAIRSRFEAVEASVFSQYSDSQNHTREAYWICPSDALRPDPSYCEEFDRVVQRSQIGGYEVKSDWYIKNLFAATGVMFNRISQIATDLECSPERCVHFCEATGVVRLDVKLAVKKLLESRNVKVIGKNGSELNAPSTFTSVLNQMIRKYTEIGYLEPLKEDPHAWAFKVKYCAIEKNSKIAYESVGSNSSVCPSR